MASWSGELTLGRSDWLPIPVVSHSVNELVDHCGLGCGRSSTYVVIKWRISLYHNIFIYLDSTLILYTLECMFVHIRSTDKAQICLALTVDLFKLADSMFHWATLPDSSSVICSVVSCMWWVCGSVGVKMIWPGSAVGSAVHVVHPGECATVVWSVWSADSCHQSLAAGRPWWRWCVTSAGPGSRRKQTTWYSFTSALCMYDRRRSCCRLAAPARCTGLSISFIVFRI